MKLPDTASFAKPLLLAGSLALALGSVMSLAQDDMRDNQPMTSDRNIDHSTNSDANPYKQRFEEKEDLDEDITAEDFVERASELGYAEIETAKIALKNSTSSDIRQFAQLMIDDHTAANQQLRTIAADSGLDMPNDADLMDKAKSMMLKVREGDSFDRAYINNQIKAHEKTIHVFQSAAAYVDNQTLREFAAQTVPILNSHLDQARQLQSQYSDDYNDADRDTDDAYTRGGRGGQESTLPRGG